MCNIFMMTYISLLVEGAHQVHHQCQHAWLSWYIKCLLQHADMQPLEAGRSMAFTLAKLRQDYLGVQLNAWKVGQPRSASAPARGDCSHALGRVHGRV